MTILNAIILGLVQGVTEFIPVSSSGHLVIISQLIGLNDAFLFDVLLNFGTLLALIVFYRKRIYEIIVKMLKPKGWGLFFKVIVATIPAVLVGVLMHNYIEFLNSMIWVVIVMLIVVGIPMIIYGKANDDADDRVVEKSVGWKSAFKIGFMQMIALIPGVSRSGITILTGLRCNLSAARAAEFSFLLAIPVISGASLKTLLSSEGIEFVKNNFAAVAVGNLVSFTAGMLAISFLIKLISNRGLKDFGWYRIGLALLLVVLCIFGVL